MGANWFDAVGGNGLSPMGANWADSAGALGPQVFAMRADHPLCRQHAKIFDAWVLEDRAMSMARFYWEWTDA